MDTQPKRPITKIHVTGGPGSGKTDLSKRISESLNLPLFDLDGIGLQLEADDKPFAMISEIAKEIASQDRWVSEGTYVGWAEPLFEEADFIVWLDIPWRIVSWRIVYRHIKATLARNNRFPGWLRLYHFWRWSRRYYLDQADLGLNEWGTPITRPTTTKFLAKYESKLIVCRSNDEIKAFLRDRIGIQGG